MSEDHWYVLHYRGEETDRSWRVHMQAHPDEFESAVLACADTLGEAVGEPVHLTDSENWGQTDPASGPWNMGDL